MARTPLEQATQRVLGAARSLSYRIGGANYGAEGQELFAALRALDVAEEEAHRPPPPAPDPRANEPDWMRTAPDRREAAKARRIALCKEHNLSRWDASDADLHDPPWIHFAIAYDAVDEVYSRACSDEDALATIRARWEVAQGRPVPPVRN